MKFGFHFCNPRVHLLLSDIHPRRVLFAEELDGFDVMLSILFAAVRVVAAHATHILLHRAGAIQVSHPLQMTAFVLRRLHNKLVCALRTFRRGHVAQTTHNCRVVHNWHRQILLFLEIQARLEGLH